MSFYRCQNDACRAKWHRVSLEYMAAPKARTSLLDIAPAPGAATGCPTCGGKLEQERGFLTETENDLMELFRRQSAAAARRLQSPVYNFRLEEDAIAKGLAPGELDLLMTEGDDDED